MSLTGAKIQSVFRKLLYTNETTSPASVRITAANNDEVAVTSLAVDITGNAATATNGITTASAVTTLSGNSGGRATTITAAEGTSIATNTTNIASNDIDIATNVTAIALNTAKVTYDGATQVATNVTDIATNTTAIALNTAKVTYDGATQVATNVTNIASNVTNIASNDTDIATNVTNIASNDTDIATNVTAIALNTAKTGITAGQASEITANTAKVTNATHIGDVTGSTTLTIKNDVTLAGNPTTTTQDPNNNSFKIATTEYVDAQVATVVDSAPGTLNTLNELAAALGDDANYAATTATAIGLKAPIASPTFTGTVGIPNYADVETTLDGIATNATNISSNDTDIATNVTNIATNATNISGNDTDIATNVTAIALNTAKVTNATHTGDVTGATALTIADDAVTAAHIAHHSGPGVLLFNAVGNPSLGLVQASHITNDTVSYAKIQNVVDDERILGRVSGADGVVEELTAANVVTMCDILTTTTASSTYQPKVSGVSDTEIGYLDGVTSAIQTQIDAKADSTGYTSNRAMITTGGGGITVSDVTETELGYLDGVTSSIQTQLSARTTYGIANGNTLKVDEADGGMTATNGQIARFTGSGIQSISDTSLKTQLSIPTNTITDLALKAPLASPIFTGTQTAPKIKLTQAVFDSETDNTCNSISAGASVTVDWTTGNKQTLTIRGVASTVNFTNPVGPCNILLRVIQGDGSDTILQAGDYDDIKWPGSTVPTLSTASGAIDIISLYFDGADYYGVASLAFA
jgi:hypothetical protein